MWKDITNKREYSENRWNWKEDLGEIIGYYLGAVEIPGKYNKTFKVHSIKQESDKQIWEFSGTTVLDNKLSQVGQNTKVKIVALGKVQGDKGQEYYDWTVQVWED